MLSDANSSNGASKVRLLQAIERHGEDGYGVVSAFVASYDRVGRDGTTHNAVKEEIDRGKSSPYASSILTAHPEYDFPAWEFVEVITFGTFCYFWKFCGERFGSKGLIRRFYLLQSVKGLRNACTHNSCIISDMSAGRPMHFAAQEVTDELSRVAGIGSHQRRSKMSNDRFQQIVTTLYLHSKIASEGVARHRASSLARFAERMRKHLDYYNGNTQVLSGFGFLSKVIDAWFPMSEEEQRA